VHVSTFIISISLFFQIIDAPFFKEVEDREENMESPNSHMVVEVDSDEIPQTLCLDFQMFQAKNVESLNSRAIVVVSLDEIPSTLSVDFELSHSHVAKANPFHVTFDLDEILIVTRFDRGFCTVILQLGLEEFVEKCFAQLQIIFGLQPSVIIYIITWITFNKKHKSLYMLLECLTRSFACEIHISCRINLTSQFSTKTLTFYFLLILILMLGTHCL